MGMTPEQVKAKKTRHVEEVKIVLDDAWGRKLGELQKRAELIQRDAAFGQGSRSLVEQMDECNAEIEALLEEAGDEVLSVEFVGLHPDRYEKLVKLHAPTREQRTEAAKQDRTLSWNPQTFNKALVAACWRSPAGWTREDIYELWEAGEEGEEESADAPAGARWNGAELGSLFLGAQAACTSRHTVQ
jgi:hypothetical protein